jgi:hypothetical protein
MQLFPCDHEDQGTQGLLGKRLVMLEESFGQVLHVGGQPMVTDVLRSPRLGHIEAGIWGNRIEVLNSDHAFSSGLAFWGMLIRLEWRGLGLF